MLICLLVENIVYSRRLKHIPVRITISGTRGKTTIVRLLASVLREQGRCVLAKTTGSDARYINPDGSEEAIPRRGLVSIIEQKKLIRRAHRQRVECLITEIMSISSENHFIETHKLIKPHITVLSNFRNDHLGSSRESLRTVTGQFLNDIYPGSRVFIHANEINSYIKEEADNQRATLSTVENNAPGGSAGSEKIKDLHFTENIDLVFSVSEFLGIEAKIIQKGIEKAEMDTGRLEVYRLRHKTRDVYFVNSFAANDPHSSSLVMEKILGLMNIVEPVIYGLLSLRSDRGERSRQWLDFVSADGNAFKNIFITGMHANVFIRELEKSEKIKVDKPGEITDHILSRVENRALIFGLANIKGTGKSLVEYWKREGERIY